MKKIIFMLIAFFGILMATFAQQTKTINDADDVYFIQKGNIVALTWGEYKAAGGTKTGIIYRAWNNPETHKWQYNFQHTSVKVLKPELFVANDDNNEPTSNGNARVVYTGVNKKPGSKVQVIRTVDENGTIHDAKRETGIIPTITAADKIVTTGYKWWLIANDLGLIRGRRNWGYNNNQPFDGYGFSSNRRYTCRFDYQHYGNQQCRHSQRRYQSNFGLNDDEQIYSRTGIFALGTNMPQVRSSVNGEILWPNTLGGHAGHNH